MKKPFEVFSEMTAANDKGLKLAPLANIDAIDIRGNNGYITIGVDVATAMRVMNEPNEFVGGLLLCEKAAYAKYSPLP